MTAKESVQRALRGQKRVANAEPPESLRDEWLRTLSALHRTVRGWLRDTVRDGLLELREEELPQRETRLGSYSAPVLSLIAPNGMKVRIVPKARLTASGRGRVDMEGLAGKSILLRTEPERWQFAELGPAGWEYNELTEESFWRHLGALLS